MTYFGLVSHLSYSLAGQERSSVPLALALNGTDFEGRPIRITHSVDSDKIEQQKSAGKV